MLKLSTKYRLLVFTILCCICAEAFSCYVFQETTHAEVEQQDNQETYIKATQPEAVIPVSTFQVVKCLLVCELFFVEILNHTLASYIEELHLVLSYFEVLFEVCIQVNAP